MRQGYDLSTCIHCAHTDCVVAAPVCCFTALPESAAKAACCLLQSVLPLILWGLYLGIHPCGEAPSLHRVQRKHAEQDLRLRHQPAGVALANSKSQRISTPCRWCMHAHTLPRLCKWVGFRVQVHCMSVHVHAHLCDRARGHAQAFPPCASAPTVVSCQLLKIRFSSHSCCACIADCVGWPSGQAGAEVAGDSGSQGSTCRGGWIWKHKFTNAPHPCMLNLPIPDLEQVQTCQYCRNLSDEAPTLIGIENNSLKC